MSETKTKGLLTFGLNPQDELAILDIFSAHLRRATDAGA